MNNFFFIYPLGTTIQFLGICFYISRWGSSVCNCVRNSSSLHPRRDCQLLAKSHSCCQRVCGNELYHGGNTISFFVMDKKVSIQASLVFFFLRNRQLRIKVEDRKSGWRKLIISSIVCVLFVISHLIGFCFLRFLWPEIRNNLTLLSASQVFFFQRYYTIFF